jgi:hypothetical protein
MLYSSPNKFGSTVTTRKAFLWKFGESSFITPTLTEEYANAAKMRGVN